jgi:phage-related minor tail protein
MEKTLALILEKQNQLLEEKEEPKLLIEENEPLNEEAKYKLDTVEFMRLLERREKLVKNLTNRLEKQDKLVEELMNRVSEQDKMVEDLTSRLEEQDQLVEDQSNRL